MALHFEGGPESDAGQLCVSPLWVRGFAPVSHIAAPTQLCPLRTGPLLVFHPRRSCWNFQRLCLRLGRGLRLVYTPTVQGATHQAAPPSEDLAWGGPLVWKEPASPKKRETEGRAGRQRNF